MARPPNPRADILRALLVKSGNRCAFPGCEHRLVNDKHYFVAEVAHIEAASALGPRFNPDSTDEARRSYKNLLILCHAHHVEVDRDLLGFPVQKLNRIKFDHEAGAGSYKPSEDIVRELVSELEDEWHHIMATVEQVHPIPELAYKWDPEAPVIELCAELREAIQRLGDEAGRMARELNDFEMYALFAPNISGIALFRLLQLEARSLRMQTALSPHDDAISERLRTVADEIRTVATSHGYVD